jgi:pyridoxamine 5'-phosphate oxidase
VPLDVVDCDPNPFVQFASWFDEAKDVLREREAITLVTASRDAKPSARMVLLRHYDEVSFGWYTNYESRKGHELEENPFASLLWYCEPLGRQIRIEGRVERASDADSDAYFASRPRGHQIGALASHQSTTLASRADLERRVRELEASFQGQPIPRPDYWGGYRLFPSSFEFWQHRSDRLHDRVFYVPRGTGWHLERRAP